MCLRRAPIAMAKRGVGHIVLESSMGSSQAECLLWTKDAGGRGFPP